MPETDVHAQRNRSNRTTEREDAFVRMKERKDLEAARRHSLIDEETRQMGDRG